MSAQYIVTIPLGLAIGSALGLGLLQWVRHCKRLRNSARLLRVCERKNEEAA